MTAPARAAAESAAAAHAELGPVLFALALLVVAAKLAGILAERIRLPSVLGELLAGVAVGNALPYLFGGDDPTAARSHPALVFLGEIGVLILLFDVGLDADLRALARVGRSAVLVALIGVGAPILLGWAASTLLLPDEPPLLAWFVGAALSATSVGISVRVLKDLGRRRSAEGQIILGAALLDDVLGLIVLAVVVGIAAAPAGGTEAATFAGIGRILLSAIAFLAVTIGLGHLLWRPTLRFARRSGHPEAMLVFGLAACFSLAYLAERIGLAGIIGAFAAGAMIDPYGRGVRTSEDEATLAELLHPLSSLFVPLFFVLMGAQVELRSLASPAALSFGLVLVGAAVAGKLACAIGVREPGVGRLAVAIGMLPRGEVGLIFAGIGSTIRIDGEPLLGPDVFAALVLMVLVTTLVAPIALRRALPPSGEGEA